METRRAVVLASGGLDSTVCLALAGFDYPDVRALGVYYGQRHSVELEYAEAVAAAFGMRSSRVTIDPVIWKSVPLVAPPEFRLSPEPANDHLERGRNVYAIRDGGIPRSVVPGRNAVFLAHAIAYAATLGGGDVLFGANQDDARGFVDCRPEAVAAFDELARATTDGAVHVRAPLLFCTKRQIAWLAGQLGIDAALTWSCYRPRMLVAGVMPCGRCDACVFRADALAHPEAVYDGPAAQAS